jgi:hypothetical protein
VSGAVALATVLPAAVAGGLVWQAQRVHAIHVELEAYIAWMLADIRRPARIG